MPQVHVDFVPMARRHQAAVVIDALRMTTTATALFSFGLAELVVVADIENARRSARADNAMLLGERHGVKVDGFDGGNSPLEYHGEHVRDRKAVLCTSNGSKAVETVASARHVFLGALVNARSVAEAVLATGEQEILLVCAGTEGEVSLDDVLAAGCIAAELHAQEPGVELTDACRLALHLYQGTPEPLEVLRQSRHGAALEQLGFGPDLAFAAKVNSLSVVGRRFIAAPARFRVS